MQQHQLKGSLMLFFCALIWGLAFVAQSVGADHVGAFTFNGLRSLIGAVFLIPCVAFFDRLAGRPFSIWGTLSVCILSVLPKISASITAI